MESRLDYAKVAPEGVRAMYGVEKYIAGCGLEHPLLELIKIRVSQINGCAFCIDMHFSDLAGIV
jgi:alkylhydroperoxidase family enzyme